MRKRERAGQDTAAPPEQETAQSGSPGGSVARRLTPVDVQQKVFRLSVRGYNEREVDQFLDEVTEEIARLHAENKRLREDLDSRGTVRLSTDVALEGDALIRQARAEADRIIAEAEARTGTLSRDTQWKAGMGRFLSREKEFLQSLASLIQGHAERVKEDAQRARDELAPRPPAPSTAEPLIDLTRPEQRPGPAPAREAREARRSGAEPESAMSSPWAGPRPLETADVDRPQEQRSVRELFWGEE